MYLVNICIKYYSKRIFPNLKWSKKLFLITATSRVEKVMDKLLDAGDFFGELVAVSVLDKPNFQHDTITVVPVEDILNFATHEVVDEVFINLPSEEYDIGEFISRFETMGIDVTVNLNAFDHNLGINVY